MTGEHLLAALAEAGVRRATGVPCSYFGSFFQQAAAPGSPVPYVPAAHEGLAVSLACGWALAGELPVALMQNSGLGNAINPLTSLVAPFRIPLLLLVSGRAWHVEDEPQHALMGKGLEAFLEAAAVECQVCPREPASLAEALRGSARRAVERGGAVALIVAKGTFEKVTSPPPAAPGRPTRREVLDVLVPRLGDRAVVATTGFTSRDLFAAEDRPRNFYMQGSMGHAAAIGLGLSQMGHRVVVLDGDGAALMHPGAMGMVGQSPGLRLAHIVLDNGVHESTGNQPIANAPVDWCATARAFGYRRVAAVDTASALARELDLALESEGPACLVVRIRVDEAAPSPRVSGGLEHDGVARRMRESLRTGRPTVARGSREP